MDISLLALPQLQDRISEILLFVQKIDLNNLKEDDKIQLAVYDALLKQSDLNRIQGDLETTLNEDKNFYGESHGLKQNLEPQLRQLIQFGEEFRKELSHIKNPTPNFKLDHFIEKGLRFQKSSFESWSTATQELDSLIEKRIQILTSEKYQSLFFSLLGLCFAVLTLFWISNHFNKNMKTILEALKGAVSKTQESGQDLVKLSERLADISSHQASAIEETSSAISEIESMTKSTMNHVSNTKKMSEEGALKSEETTQAMQNLQNAISEISFSNSSVLSQIEDSKNEMEKIVNIISDIGSKTKIINEIVFQTKLLSFNASVEAARAGEYGKGFTVVATEVGQLAEMSGHASKDITSLLATSVHNVRSMSDNTNIKVTELVSTSKEKIEWGNNLAIECLSSIEDIQNRIQSVLSSSLSILSGAEEQSKGIEEISKSIEKIHELSYESKLMSEQTEEQSKTIANQAQLLKDIAHHVEMAVLGQNKESSFELPLQSPYQEESQQNSAA